MHLGKYLFTSLLCFLFISQSLSQYSFKKPKGTYGLVLGFDFGLRKLSTQENSQPEVGHYFYNKETALLSFRLGFNYSRFIGGSLYLKSGLRVINPTYQVGTLVALNSEDKFRLTKEEKIVVDKWYKYRYYFLEVPLHLRYVYSGRNCRSFVEGGISTQYYLGTQLIEKFGNENTQFLKEKISPLYFHATISIGAEYDLTENIPAFIQMVCRYQINAIDKGQVLERQFSFGLEAGSRYYF